MTEPRLAAWRRVVLGWTAVVVVGVSVSTALPTPGAQGAFEIGICYSVADNGSGADADMLIRFDHDGTDQEAVGTNVITTNTGTSDVEAIAMRPPLSDGTPLTLFTADGGTLGTLSTTNGAFTSIGAVGTSSNAITVASGSSTTSVTFSDIDGLTYDPFTGKLWGIHRTGTVGVRDQLLIINPGTGAFVPGSFLFDVGNDGDLDAVDSVPVVAASGQTIANIDDIDDLAIDPEDGTLYGVANSGGDGDQLVSINKITGAATLIGTTLTVDDIEGLGFSNVGATFGDFYGTTGANSDDTGADPDTDVANADSFYEINVGTGAVVDEDLAAGKQPIAKLVVQESLGTTMSDYEGIDCLTNPSVNTYFITGRVYHDANEDGTFNAGDGDSPTQSIGVNLYIDAGNENDRDGDEVKVDQGLTAADGTYSFTVSVAQGTAAPEHFVLDINDSSLPANAVLTTDNLEEASFQGIASGTTDANNDFAYQVNPAASIGDTVFGDLDADGVQDAGENGIQNVTVRARRPGGDGTYGTADDVVITSVTTDVNGNYDFTGLVAGQYRVDVDSSTLPAGLRPDTTSATVTYPHVVTLTQNQDYNDADLGFTPLVDLQLTKTVADATRLIGDTTTYTVVVTNASADTAATGVEVTDVLPSGVTLDTGNVTMTQGTFTAGTGVWTVGSLTVSGGATPSATLTLPVTVNSVGAKANSAEVSAADQRDLDSTPDNLPTDEDDDASATVTGQAIDLELAKTVSPSAVEVGGTATWTLTVTNQSTTTQATNVTVTDVLPAGVTLGTPNPSTGTFNASTGVWTVGTLSANGASATLQLPVTVTATGDRTNTAEITAADQPDADSTPGNDSTNEDDDASSTLTVTTVPDPPAPTPDPPTPSPTPTPSPSPSPSPSPAPAGVLIPPVAIDDYGGGPVDEPATLHLLNNDHDEDGVLVPPTLQILRPPEHGDLIDIDLETGRVVYLPDPGFEGEDSFDYRICDNDDLCDDATAYLATPPIDLSITIDLVGDLNNRGRNLYLVTITNLGPRRTNGPLTVTLDLSPFLSEPEATSETWETWPIDGIEGSGVQLLSVDGGTVTLELAAESAFDPEEPIPAIEGERETEMVVREASDIFVDVFLDAPPGSAIRNSATVAGLFVEITYDNNDATVAHVVPPDPVLPQSGSDADRLGLVAAALLAVGAGLVLWGEPRPRRYRRPDAELRFFTAHGGFQRPPRRYRR